MSDKLITGRWYEGGKNNQQRYLGKIVNCPHHGEEAWYSKGVVGQEYWCSLRAFKKWVNRII